MAYYSQTVLKAYIHRVVPSSVLHHCSDNCRAYYPWQSCSNMCGVIVICMAAVMSINWDEWRCWNSRSTPPLISEPSKNHNELRLLVMFWIIKSSIKTDYLIGKERLNTVEKEKACCSDDDFEPLIKKAKLQPKEDIPD